MNNDLPAVRPDWRTACLDALDLMRDDPQAGRLRGQALLADARASGDAGMARGAELVLAFADHYEHRIDPAGEAFARLLPAIEESGDVQALKLCLFGLMVTWRLRNRLADAYRLGRERLLPLLGDAALRENIIALNAMGIISHECGHTEEAVAHFYAALDAARRLQLPARIAHISANIGEIFYVSCNAADAEALLVEARDIGRSAREPWILAYTTTLLALTRLALEKYDAAYDLIVDYLPESAIEAPGAAAGGIDQSHRIFFLSVAAFTLAKRCQLDEADALNQRALALLARAEDRRLEPYTWWVSGHLHHLHGRLDEAVQELERAVELIGDRGYLYMPLHAMQELAQIHEARGEWERAYREFHRFHALSMRAQSQSTIVRLETLRIKNAIKEAELARRHAEESLAERDIILDNAMVAIMFLNQEGRVQWANQALYRMFGLPPGNHAGASLKPFFKDEDAYYGAGQAARQALAEGRHFEYECQMRRADGTLFWTYTSGRAVNPRDPSRGTVWAVMDITRRRQLEQDLSQSEDHYRQVINNVTECIIVVQDLHVVFANPRVFELTGYGPDELYAMPFLEGIHPDDRADVASRHARRLRGDKLDQHYQFRLISKHRPDQPIWVELSGVMIDWEGRPATLSFMTDVTERRRLEESLKHSMEERMRLQTLQIENELREAEIARKLAEETTRAKSMFLANMSHEIRTPMNAIIGMAHLALRTELNAKQRDYVEKIHGAGVSLLGILNDILDFSKVEAGKIDLEHVEFNLERVFDNVAAVTSGNAHEKDLEYLLQMAPALPRNLMGDPLRVGQVLINLVNNAIKFTERGEICVACVSHGMRDGRLELEFTVRDTGIGMSAEQAGQLFQPFMQADGSTTRKYGGTGLGLSICKGMVELMGGRIWLESTEGKGTTVHFTALFDLAPVQPVREVVPQAINGVRILVVDDNPVARQILAENLSALPVSVDTADSAEEALQLIRTADMALTPYGVVFSDVRMPGMDGFDLTRLVKQPGALAAPPKVVLVSAYDRDEVGNVGAVGRADAFLSKPVNASGLYDTMLDLLAPDGRVARVAASVAIPAFRDLRVLLVEDNEINQQIAAELMDAAGIQTDIARNGRVALEMLAAVPPEHYGAILMDVQMPEMDGHEATRRIRADARFADLPIIAMTAHAMVEERARCAASGMDDHITKPINPADLFDALSRWCPLNAYQSVQEEIGFTDAGDLQIAGVDVAEGLARTLGNREFYFDMLRRFREGQRYAVSEIRDALHQDDQAQAERIAHTLKGVAGQLGARDIQAQAAQVEKCMRDGAPESTWGPLLARLEGDLRALDAELARVLPGEAPPPAPQAHSAEDLQRLALFRRLLQESDGEAADMLAEVAPLLEARLGGEAHKRLARAVRHYDYDAALAEMADLAGLARPA